MWRKEGIYTVPFRANAMKEKLWFPREQRKTASSLNCNSSLRKEAPDFLQRPATINLGGLWLAGLERRRLEEISRGKWSLLVASQRSY